MWSESPTDLEDESESGAQGQKNCSPALDLPVFRGAVSTVVVGGFATRIHDKDLLPSLDWDAKCYFVKKVVALWFMRNWLLAVWFLMAQLRESERIVR